MSTDAVRELSFPDGFLWGAATSAYQVEGAVTADGRGPSIWDTLCAVPGAIKGGDTGDVAVDHYRLFREDVALMKRLGLPCYRFSIAWPRIQPEGTGPANAAGLAFYERLVDELLAAGIEPLATVYHWDLPQALQDGGGWAARDTCARFADYAALVFAALHDRIGRWATLNEPWCSTFLGHVSGDFAPGIRDPRQAVRAAHHLLLGHGLAVASMRAIDERPELGICLNPAPFVALGDPASERLREGIRRLDGLRNRIWTGPLLHGAYPADVMADLEAYGGLPVEGGDMATIARPLDWLGVNYYHDELIEEAAGATVSHSPGVRDVREAPPPPDATDIGWPLTPDGLRALLVSLRDEHPGLPPLYVTENGAAYDDAPAADGRIHDARRIRYLDTHLRALRAAIAAGVDVRGYFCWSLMDNFEWAQGYAMRFGLVHVDLASQRRTPRDSAFWYRDVIARNGLEGVGHGGDGLGGDGGS